MKSGTRIWIDRSVGVKLAVFTVVAAIGLGAVGYAGLSAVSDMKSQVSWQNQTWKSRLSWEQGLTGIETMLENLREGELADDEEATDVSAPWQVDYAKAVTDTTTGVLYVTGVIKSDPRVPADAVRGVEAVEEALKTYVTDGDAAVAAVQDGDRKQIKAADEAFHESGKELATAMAPITAVMNETVAGVEDDIASAAGDARTGVLLYAAIALLLLVAVAWAVRRAVIRPLRQVSDALDGMAAGDLTITAAISSKDEVGRMAQSLDRAQGAMRDAIAAVSRSATQVDDSSSQLSEVTAQITVAVEEVTAQAGAAAAVSNQISGSVQTVAAGAEEMGASIGEIARNASSAAGVAGEAVGVAAETNRAMAELSDSSVQIGKVVSTITSIAEQTNLLALNATIEAARAGDMGKGFAVVAHEVKDLAQETAEATAEITHRVAAIQAKAEEAVEAIARISGIINRINDYQGTIASAVEQQSATTAEINRSMTQAATGTTEIAASVDSVATAARQTGASVAQAQASADELAALSGELRQLVDRFRV